jgi:hypothetical protein
MVFLRYCKWMLEVDRNWILPSILTIHNHLPVPLLLCNLCNWEIFVNCVTNQNNKLRNQVHFWKWMLLWLWNMLFVYACVLSKLSTSIRHAAWALSLCLPYGTLHSIAGCWLAALSTISSALLREFIYILGSFSCMSLESLTDINCR